MPLLMGILNVTPDSFSDGGEFADPKSALEQAEHLLVDGADIIDIGGESTRPGAAGVSVEEELRRVIPVVEAVVRRQKVPVSVDTTKWEVARAALRAGASIINDVSGGADIRFAELVRETKATIILMHRQGTPLTMQQAPFYPQGIVEEVFGFLSYRVQSFLELGISRDQLWVDPGIGFGKTLDHNLELLRELAVFREIGGRLVIGTSRKSFLAHLLGDRNLSFEQREAGTLSSNLWALQQGAGVLRVHDVGAMRRAIETWAAIQGRGPGG